MYKELYSYYNMRFSSLLYIFDSDKKCKKEVLKYGGTQYCISNDVDTIDTWSVPHNENGISPNIPINSSDTPYGINQQRLEVRGY